MKSLKTGLLALVSLSLIGLGLASCGQERLVQNKQTREAIQASLEARAGWLPQMPAGMNTAEHDAMDFLYAYLPVGDVADYTPELFLTNVRSSLQARTELPWGKDVPTELFLHYVLPVRVNNENLDTARVVFYGELRDRVKGLSMEDAILEVNHWCHEKVIYTPSDGRTMAPLALVRNAQGRCGEESTFTVTALRSVGIPARQVYTPRWAHTDDNHAWIEAWANGKWYYMGACEPEPVLNMGWFDAPSKRGMLMHTKIFGPYQAGDEEIIVRNPLFTEINVTHNYAPVSTATVVVTDASGQRVPNVQLDFGIYNYAEFYPAARKTTDSLGVATMTAGRGDMLVWATDGARFGYGKLSFGKMDTLTIALTHAAGEASYQVDFDITPPVEAKAENRVTREQRAANDLRLAREDSIRTAYIATWMQQPEALALAAKIGADGPRVWELIETSRGNYAEIARFLADASTAGQTTTALELLEIISTKDLQDTPAAILTDHLSGAVAYKDQPFFKEYILNPRVATELLVSYRAALATAPNDIKSIIAKAQGIQLVDSLNPGRLPISAIGVDKLGMGDKSARDRYFICMARTKGIPARYEPVTRRLQYYDTAARNWSYVEFEQADNSAAAVTRGTLMVRYTPTKRNPDPKFYNHFTLGKLNQGRYTTIALDSPEVDMGGAGSLKTIFTKPVSLETGDYMLVSGTRMANGTVLNQTQFFSITSGAQTTVEMVMRESDHAVQVIGTLSSEATFLPIVNGIPAAEPTSILATTGRGYFVVGLLEVGKEPTNHALRDIAALKAEFEQWGRGIILLFPSREAWERFKPAEFGALPSTITYGIDADGSLAAGLRQSLELGGRIDLPLVVVGDTFNRVVFTSQGYTIGLGDQLMKIIRAL